MPVEILAHRGPIQSVHTERLGVVSGEGGILEVSGNVQDKGELALLLGDAGGLLRIADELDRCAEGLAPRPWLARLADVADVRIGETSLRRYLRQVGQGYRR